MWPARLVMQLKPLLSPGYVSGPNVHPGAQVEVDVATCETDHPSSGPWNGHGVGDAATATWTAAEPSRIVETDVPDDDEYEVRIYDVERDRTLVAVIELVSPANKDRADKRNRFVGKCSALLRQGVAVSIVDVVTTRQANLYAELLASLGHTDPTMSDESPAIYATSCRWLLGERRGRLESWSHSLTVGQPLPTLPLWLAPNRVVPLNLEQSYESACDDLSIR